MNDFDVSACDECSGPLRRVCRGEIGTESQIATIRGHVLRGKPNNARGFPAFFADKQNGFSLGGLSVSTPFALGSNRPDNLPVLIDGGHASGGVNTLVNGGGDQATESNQQNSSHGSSPVGCKNCDKAQTMSIYDRFTTFVKTQAKTMISGFADDETIKARLSICESCPHLKKNHCELCGCKCNGGANFMNKLGHKSSVCPDNPPRWGAAE